MAKLVWRMKLIAELESAIVSETEVARIEREDFAVPETLGLTLDEGKRLMASTQVEIVRAQVSTMGERFRWCEQCGAKLLSKGYYPATFRSVFGDVGVRVRRLRACGCRAGEPEPKKALPPCSPPAVWRPNWPMSRQSSPRSRRSPGLRICCPNFSRSVERPMLVRCEIAPCGSARR